MSFIMYLAGKTVDPATTSLIIDGTSLTPYSALRGKDLKRVLKHERKMAKIVPKQERKTIKTEAKQYRKTAKVDARLARKQQKLDFKQAMKAAEMEANYGVSPMPLMPATIPQSMPQTGPTVLPATLTAGGQGGGYSIPAYSEAPAETGENKLLMPLLIGGGLLALTMMG
jgi:hypothetical protein